MSVVDRGRLYEVEELEDELLVSLLCPNNASKQDVKCQITAKKLKLTVKGETLLAGTFYGAVIPDDSIWQFGELLGQWDLFWHGVSANARHNITVSPRHDKHRKPLWDTSRSQAPLVHG